MKVIAIDFGEKHVGLAVSDPEGRMALALPRYEMKGDGRDAERLADVVRNQGAERVVIGLPLNMDGSEGPAAERVREFGEDLSAFLEGPPEFWDERLTTEEAKGRLGGLPMSRHQKKSHVHTVSAQIILESYLEGGGR